MSKSENAGKPISECLQLLLTEMRHLKLGLPPPFRTDEIFHAKLIQAYQAVPAYTYTCCKLAADISGLIEELESSIATHEIQEKMANTTLFTDRRYYHQNTPYSTNRGYDKQTPFCRPPYPETPPRATTYQKPPGYTYPWQKMLYLPEAGLPVVKPLQRGAGRLPTPTEIQGGKSPPETPTVYNGQ